jgi:hypothetical protein
MEFPLSGRTFALLSLMGASLAASAPANAQTVDDQQKAVIEVIISTAHSLCYDLATASRTKAEGVKGDVKAQLTGLASKIADIGLTGAGDITDSETEGVLQTDLAAALKDSAACKTHVLDTLGSSANGGCCAAAQFDGRARQSRLYVLRRALARTQCGLCPQRLLL